MSDEHDVETAALEMEGLARATGKVPNMLEVVLAARRLFDGRIGGVGASHPCGPRELWAQLGEALYGPRNPNVCELRAMGQAGDEW